MRPDSRFTAAHDATEPATKVHIALSPACIRNDRPQSWKLRYTLNAYADRRSRSSDDDDVNVLCSNRQFAGEVRRRLCAGEMAIPGGSSLHVIPTRITLAHT